jgi:hypothetical protein
MSVCMTGITLAGTGVAGQAESAAPTTSEISPPMFGLLEGERPREPHGECAEKPPPYGGFLRPKENRE